MTNAKTIADGTDLACARNRLPALVICIALHLFALGIGCELFGTKRFIDKTWPIGGSMLALYALSMYSTVLALREHDR